MFAVFTGLVAGLLHVLSGPDHLAAVAPIAVRGHRRAWFSGLRWGIGHSAGVLLIGLLAIAFRQAIPIERISQGSERLVGVLLIGIGLWSLREALRVEVHTHSHEHDGVAHGHVHFHGPGHAHDADVAAGAGIPSEDSHLHGHAAFGIGTLHGLAGSSHFLGVLPSLAFTSRWESVSYMVAFAVGTVLAMAGFSAVLGAVAARWTGAARGFYRALLWACAVVAFGVGTWWLFGSVPAA